MAWLQKQDDDGDLFPSGYGIIEIAGLNAEMIDSIDRECKDFCEYREEFLQADLISEREK